MSKQIKITTLPGKEPLVIDSGKRIFDIFTNYPDAFLAHPKGLYPVGATINNQLASLSDKVTINCQINLVYSDSIVGADIYRRSLAFLLYMAWYHIHPETHLTISHSMGHAFYFILDNESEA